MKHNVCVPSLKRGATSVKRSKQSNEKIPHLKNLIDLATSFHNAAHEYYPQQGLQYVDVPAIVGITGACENIDTLFRVGNRRNIPLFFTQTGQLSLEHALQFFPGAYTVIHSGRDEEYEDERHLRQFRLTEEEFDWSMTDDAAQPYDEEKMYEALLTHIEDAVTSIAQRIIEKNKKILKNEYKRDSEALIENLKKPFFRITYKDALYALKQNGFPRLAWGDDLKAHHEAMIVKLLAKKSKNEERPVFIMRYPKEIKFFNMKVSEKDDRVVLSADLIFPYAGEGVGSAVREHNGEKLKQRLLGSTMFRLHQARGGTYDDFKWYTEELVAAKKTKPHAGYGLGNERLLQYILGSNDIRACSVFSAMAHSTQNR